MNFELDESQAMLKETVDRLLADTYDFETRRRIGRTPEGWSRTVWSSLAEMGLLAAPFAEEDGGLGGGAVETLVIAEAFGARLVAEPYLASIVAAGAALRHSSNAALRADVATHVTTGACVMTWAHEETGRGPLKTRAVRTEHGWVLTGAKINVAGGGYADCLLVTAQTDEGPGVFLVDATFKGLSRRAYATFDGLRAAEITLDGVEIDAADVLGLGDEAAALIERVRQATIAWLAAEACGISGMLLEVTVEHLKTRKQFGQPLAKFQALQHKAAEMLVALEQIRSMALYAAMMLDDPDAEERRKAFAAVKAVIGLCGKTVGQTAVQLHGGLGVTEEHRAGWGHRRLLAIDLALGDYEAAAAELAGLGGFTAGDTI